MSADYTQFDEVADFYAHALAIEREAALRYRDLADQMRVHNNAALEHVFLDMSHAETGHAFEIERRSHGMLLPQLEPFQLRWISAESPESVPYDSAHYLMTARHALEGALAAERRACDYFGYV